MAGGGGGTAENAKPWHRHTQALFLHVAKLLAAKLLFHNQKLNSSKSEIPAAGHIRAQTTSDKKVGNT